MLCIPNHTHTHVHTLVACSDREQEMRRAGKRGTRKIREPSFFFVFFLRLPSFFSSSFYPPTESGRDAFSAETLDGPVWSSPVASCRRRLRFLNLFLLWYLFFATEAATLLAGEVQAWTNCLTTPTTSSLLSGGVWQWKWNVTKRPATFRRDNVTARPKDAWEKQLTFEAA